MAAVSFDAACGRLEQVLAGSARRDILAAVSASNDFTQALRRLRASMRAHTWKVGADRLALAAVVARYDRRTRQDGFHVLHDWDGKADHVNDDIIPVDVLDYLIVKRGDGPADAVALAILLDYYSLHLLTLLSLRVWDDG